MSTVSDLEPPPRRRRADAERSFAAILDAAEGVLGHNPQAGMEEVATAAGISRQTVYAHFVSRDALIDALLDRVTAKVVAAIDAADLADGPVMDALMRLLAIAWDTFAGEPFLLRMAGSRPRPERPRTGDTIRDRLEELFRRGQAEGDFDPELSVHWLLESSLSMSRVAGEQVRRGRMTSEDALRVLGLTIARAFRPG